MRIAGRGWLLAAVGGVVAEALTLVLILTSSHENQKELNAALILLVSGSFMISGLVGWRRRPENRMGPLLYVAGMSWCLNSLWEANDRWIYTLGAVFGSLPIAIFVHLLVVYPTGRLEGRLARAVVFTVYPVAVLANFLPALFDPTSATTTARTAPRTSSSSATTRGLRTRSRSSRTAWAWSSC